MERINTNKDTDNSEIILFQERQLLRLRKFQFLERSIAEHMEAIGHMRLFEKELNLDLSDYPYPFGKVGAAKLTLCELTDAGSADLVRVRSHCPSLPNALMKFKRGPLASVHRDRIVFTEQGALKMIEEGRRDILVVLNTGLINPVNTYDPEGSLELDSLHRLIS